MDATASGKIVRTPGRRTSTPASGRSRNGCSNCKSRKIKCGEEQPSCLNCIRRSKACSYAETSPNVADARSIPGNTPPCRRNTPQLLELNTLDLELLHHYSTLTCLSISNDATMETFWRVEVPQIGFSNEYVIRGILAVTALHLARFSPEREHIFIPYSVHHHEAALREATAILPEITTQNYAPLHLVSAINCIYYLGSPRTAINFLVGGSGLSEWLFLFRGIKTIIESAPEERYSGALAPLIQAAHKRLLLRETLFVGAMRLEELRNLVLESANNESRTQVYLLAIEDLEKSFSVVYGCPSCTCKAADIFTWHSHLSEDYLLLLQGGAQEALAIFAYSCALFQKLEYLWWMEGWSVRFISQIYGLLDEEHRLWIRWPIERIGWIP